VNRIFAIARKEFLHVLRDRRSLALAILMPIVMVFLYGYAINMEMKHLKVGVLDEDQSVASRDLVRRMTSSQFVTAAARLSARNEVERGFRRGTFRAVLAIPRGYEESLKREPTTYVQVLIDGADGTTASTANASNTRMPGAPRLMSFLTPRDLAIRRLYMGSGLFLPVPALIQPGSDPG